MTILFTVYDSHGEPFEVRPDAAKNLVINHGWSMNAPEVSAPSPLLAEKTDDPSGTPRAE